MKTLTNEQIEWLRNMAPFDVNKTYLPSIPVTDDEQEFKEIIVGNLIRCGAIPKCHLEIGAEYVGFCRNSSKATWDGENFKYKRYKWGTYYTDTIKHFEDDMYSDIFVPLKKIN